MVQLRLHQRLVHRTRLPLRGPRLPQQRRRVAAAARGLRRGRCCAAAVTELGLLGAPAEAALRELLRGLALHGRRMGCGRAQRPLRKPGVPERVPHRHAGVRVHVHEREDEVFGLMGQRAAPALLLEEPLGAVQEERVVRIVDAGISAVEHRLGSQEVEGAPAQTPSVHLRRDILLLHVELWRPELLRHEAIELHRLLLACHGVDREGHRLPRVAHPHVPLLILENV
mmetsp:Transcript_71586/g.197641  ORF Transcript_71586/g.197641 Transcript_71586/m.197641 type:complete len:227 (-) Transcript_71586:727-1407(-)